MNERTIQFLQMFATTVLKCRLPDHARLNAGLLETINGLRAATEGRTRSNVIGWQSGNLDFDVPVVAELASLILERAREYGLAHSWSFPSHMQLIMRELWANVSGKHAQNSVHNHPNSLLSGVYYVQAETESGDLSLIDPRKQAWVMQPDFSERNQMNSPIQFMSPEAGTLIIFPSWLEHGVNQNLTDVDRISIAFNINLFHEQMVNNPG